MHTVVATERPYSICNYAQTTPVKPAPGHHLGSVAYFMVSVPRRGISPGSEMATALQK